MNHKTLTKVMVASFIAFMSLAILIVWFST
jgi:hypothetical protein